MNPLRSVGGRLSIALLLVVAGALGIVYLVVVPRLQERLVDARVSEVAENARTVAFDAYLRARDDPFAPGWGDLVSDSAALFGTRTVMFEPTRDGLRIVADSSPGTEPIRIDEVIAKAITTGDQQSGDVTHEGRPYAESVVPAPSSAYTAYFLLSSPLAATYETVGLVERRLLYAGLIALAIVLAVGFVAARMFARRIRRLERAADRIATGYFDQPVEDAGKDELGELAAAFERMRQRLAHLEHARREFIANASHELRTPLFALAGLLELLDDEELDDETRREFLGTAREQSDRLTKLATDLLDLSRLDAGRLHVERQTVELEELADVLQDEFRAVAQGSEHPLDVHGERVAAVADEQRILQVGRVLIDNALLHTPPGTSIRIVTAHRDGHAVLSVEDDGPGIPQEHLAHVFERFYRVNGTVTSGSGLGLAIARELAELMGGELEVASQPGRTTFTLTLPPAALPVRTPVA